MTPKKQPAPPTRPAWAEGHEERWELAVDAAFGSRRPVARRARGAVYFGLKALSRALRPIQDDGKIGHYELVPAPATRTEAAELLARLNWYLPAIWEGGAEPADSACWDVVAADAPWMDPELIRQPRVTPSVLGETKRHYILHHATARSVWSLATKLGRTTIVDPMLFYTTDFQGFRRLRLRLNESKRWEGNLREAIERFFALQGAASALVVGTGPSATSEEVFSDDADVRVICNSAVKNEALVEALRPQIVAFGDPVFHFGPSRYAATFREDMLKAVESADSLVVVPSWQADLLLDHFPMLHGRVIPLEMTQKVPWRWVTRGDLRVRASGNVLTEMMLPVALALADEIRVAGCDGRTPVESYFWKHDQAVQYDDDLMATVFVAHPAFFRDRSYVDYYDRHCRGLAELISSAEDRGKVLRSLTQSFIPALADRSVGRMSTDPKSGRDLGR